MVIWKDLREGLLARVFCANVAVLLLGVSLLALTPATVSWPLMPREAAQLTAGGLAVLLIDYIALRSILLRRRAVRRRRTIGGELTSREAEIVRLIADSYTAREIAELLCISPKTVEAHRANILQKLGVRDRVAVTRYAIRRGLIDP